MKLQLNDQNFHFLLNFNYNCIMKIAFTTLLILFYFASFSQSKFRPASVSSHKDCSESDIGVYNAFVNNFLSPDLRWVRIENTLTSVWTSAYCDCELCHTVSTDSAMFYVKVGDSCKATSGHFYPQNTVGSGKIKIKVFDPNDRNNFVIGEYMANCSFASVVFIKNRELKVSPNPVSNSLNILFGSTEPYIVQIISLGTNIIITEQVANSVKQNFDVSYLSPGAYYIKIETAKNVFYTRFLKI